MFLFQESPSYTLLFITTSVITITTITTTPNYIEAETTRATSYCNRTCGITQEVPYPFGFSPACPIQLNCFRNSTEANANPAILLGPNTKYYGRFPVVTLTQETMKINLEAKCNRPIHALQSLFAKNYAPKSTNAILLNNCKASSTTCNIPYLNVQTQFSSLMNCSTRGNISCFMNLTESGFFDYDVMKQSTLCESVLSSILADNLSSSTSLSLEVQVLELQWWVTGECRCSKRAVCDRNVKTFTGAPGFRCRCGDGFIGDGYVDGSGCRRDCNLWKYLSGECGGVIRFLLLFGGIAIGAAILLSVGLLCYCSQCRFASKPNGFKKLRLSDTTGINIPIYPYREIQRATNGFSEKNRLGTGAYGTVYAGKLQNDEWAAIKRIKHRDTDSIRQVTNEIKLISSISHPNIVRLLGCSIENGEQILVYEFMPNGTLCQHLQKERGNGLSGPLRLTIANETARAITHLHSIDPPIYHRDIKSSNILLDHNCSSKLADFGLSRLGGTETSHISTAPQGTPGYLDPQYHQNFHLSDKSDVYSFGVVLVEIITALKVVDFSRSADEVNLAALAVDRIGKGRLDEIIDPLIKQQCDEWMLLSVHKVAELAFRCLAFHRDTRPSMMEVLSELEEIRLSRHAKETEVSSSSSISEMPLTKNTSKPETGFGHRVLFQLNTRPCGAMSMERAKDYSPNSVQDPWLSEQSSPSSSSLINKQV